MPAEEVITMPNTKTAAQGASGLPAFHSRVRDVVAASRSEDPRARIAAAYHPRLPFDYRHALAGDPVEAVRKAAVYGLHSTRQRLALSYKSIIRFV